MYITFCMPKDYMYIIIIYGQHYKGQYYALNLILCGHITQNISDGHVLYAYIKGL